MSQDNEICALCGEKCGYDDSAGIWFGKEREEDWRKARICSMCKRNLLVRFDAFFGINCSNDEYGATIEWHEMKGILDKVKRDEALRISYVITDKELYERLVTVATPIES